MQSLRTRKPSQASRPRGQLQKPARDARKSTRVDDKIKKRMSMRYAEISSPTGGVPAVPSIPLGLRPAGYKGQDIFIPQTEEPLGDPREAELRLLDQDEFDPDACERHASASWWCKLNKRNRSEVEDGQLDGGGVTLAAVVTTSVEGWSCLGFAAKRLQEVRCMSCLVCQPLRSRL